MDVFVIAYIKSLNRKYATNDVKRVEYYFMVQISQRIVISSFMAPMVMMTSSRNLFSHIPYCVFILKFGHLTNYNALDFGKTGSQFNLNLGTVIHFAFWVGSVSVVGIIEVARNELKLRKKKVASSKSDQSPTILQVDQYIKRNLLGESSLNLRIWMLVFSS